MTNIKPRKKRPSTNSYVLSDDTSYYTVTMANGLSFTIDANDYAYVSSFNWYIKGKGMNYPVRDKNNSDTGYYCEYNQIYLAYDLLDVYSYPRALKGSIAVNYSDNNSMNLCRANLSFTTKQEIGKKLSLSDTRMTNRKKNMLNAIEEKEKRLEYNRIVNENHKERVSGTLWAGELTEADIKEIKRKERQSAVDWACKFDGDESYYRRNF